MSLTDRSGWRKITDGVYDDGSRLHINIPELLRANGYEPTEENISMMIGVAKEKMRELGVPVSVELEIDGEEVWFG